MINTAFRWSGLGLITGAALMAFGFALLPFTPSGGWGPLGTAPLLLSSILLLLSLPAMYARQAAAAGWLGFTGHALLQIGMLLFVVALSPDLRNPSYKPPASEGNAIDFFLAIALSLGLLLTAIATIRAGILPRWAGILLLVGTAGFFFAFFIAELLPASAGVVGVTLLGIPTGFAWIGVALVRGVSLRSAAHSAHAGVQTERGAA